VELTGAKTLPVSDGGRKAFYSSGEIGDVLKSGSSRYKLEQRERLRSYNFNSYNIKDRD
jgi:hypothetical protein